tara:strand:- start:6065 stop:7156 length:1092 start_codon:yes stop_codon:yes gene_type:complete
MRKSIAILCLIIFLSSCKKTRNDYLIEANITGIKDSTKVYLFNMFTWNIIDSTTIVNNKFIFKGKLKDPVPVSFSVYNYDIYPDFWLENNEIKINASTKQLSEKDIIFNNITIGSETNKIALRYEELMNPIYDRKAKAYIKFREKIISKEEFDKYYDTIRDVSLKFFLENPNNYFSISEVCNFRNEFKKEKLEEYFNLLTNQLKNSSYGKLLDDFLHIKILKEGDYFLDIIGANLKGEEVKLSDFKGKIILLDFWAGWCPPCIKQIKEEFPTIIEKYKDKNFQIVSFSFDVDRKMWKDASDKLELSWPDFSNLIKMSNSPVALNYGITQIPTSFIISEEGKILKRVEYSDDLEKELDKVLLQK